MIVIFDYNNDKLINNLLFNYLKKKKWGGMCDEWVTKTKKHCFVKKKEKKLDSPD